MRVGIVGTGSMGRTHAAGWSATPATIGGFVAKTTASAAALAKRYDAPVYSSFSEMLTDVDVVDICTPTHLHHGMVLEAAASGKDVVCEKPLARTIQQAQEMITACEHAGVKLLVAHVVRYFPEYALAQQQVAAGAIGQPAIIRLKRGSSGPNVPGDNWFRDMSKSGGVMLDMMIHDFDYARWIAGEVAHVFAQSVSHNQSETDAAHCLAILTHRSGALSHVEGSWAYPPRLFYTQLEIAGSNGWLQYDSQDSAALRHHYHQRETVETDVPIPASPLHEDPYTTQIRSFYDNIVSNKPTPVSAVDGLAALQIGLAVLESAETGRPVTLETLPELSS